MGISPFTRMASPDYRTAIIEPSAHTDRLAQLLEFEGITVGRFVRQDLPELRAFGPDLLVLNHMRLRAGTLPFSAAVTEACHAHPLTLAIVAQGDEMRGVELVERGLDGFIAASCGAREFVARVRAMLRRARPAPPARATDSPAMSARSGRISFPGFTRTGKRPIWSCWSAATPPGAIPCCINA